MIRGQDDFYARQAITRYGGCRPRPEIELPIQRPEAITMYGGVHIESIFPTEPSDYDKPISKYTGELNVNKYSSIKEANSQIEMRMNGGFWGSSSVSSNEHLSRIEKEYLENERKMLIADMKDLRGEVNTKNLSKVASTLSDAAQAGLTRSDARTFGLLSGELQKVVDNAETFNNFSFKEGDKKDLEDKLSANNTLSWLKSDNGKAVCAELGININNLDDIEPDENGNIVIAGKTIQLSNDKLSITEKSDKYNTYETSTYTLDDKYKPTETETEELETYEKYHTNTHFTNLDEKDYETGENLHLPQNAQISKRAMKGLVNENEEIYKELEKITGKSIGDLKFLDNHAYYIDDDGVEHQFYYDDKNGNFINANVTPNEEIGGYDVEVNVPKTKSEGILNKLTDEEKEEIDEILKKYNDEKISKAFKEASDEDKKEFLQIIKEASEYKGIFEYNMVSPERILESIQFSHIPLKQAIAEERTMARERDEL